MPTTTPARLRGIAAGLLTAALAVAAHGATGMDEHEMTAQAAPTADNAARWLAGGAIALAAVGVAAALIARRRT